jgi:sulfatase maturation enzyme AslB (radical SAM superfamily)
MQQKLAYTSIEYAAFYARLLDRVIAKNRERLFVEESTLFRLRRIYDPGFSGFVDMQSPAGVLLGALIFNYDGRIFGSDEARMLWESTKAGELVLGTIDDPPQQIHQNRFAARLLEDTFTCTSPGCDDCAYQPHCGADPLHHLSTQGDHVGDKSISFFCQLQRELFDQIFLLLENQPAARKVFESWLSR